MICELISSLRGVHGVVPVCRTLRSLGVPIAPRTYWAWRSRAPSSRQLWDITISEVLAGYYVPDDRGRRPPESLYGAVKMWAHLNREGIVVAKCTVERLMRLHGWRGATRAKTPPRTTVPDPASERPPDLVDRCFGAVAPDRLWVTDFTYVRLAGTGSGFVYTAFVIDAYAGAILGWHCSLHKKTSFVQAAVLSAITTRRTQHHRDLRNTELSASTIHHSDAGSQYTAIRYSETLALHGLIPSVGTVGDAYDNALAETIIGLYKTEAITDDSPFHPDHDLQTLTDVEHVTAAWVTWYNQHRLLHRLGLIPPADAEAHYRARHTGRLV